MIEQKNKISKKFILFLKSDSFPSLKRNFFLSADKQIFEFSVYWYDSIESEIYISNINLDFSLFSLVQKKNICFQILRNFVNIYNQIQINKQIRKTNKIK